MWTENRLSETEHKMFRRLAEKRCKNTVTIRKLVGRIYSGGWRWLVLQQANDERNKVEGVTGHHNSHQQGNKTIESGRTQNLANTVLTKGMTTTDEFKYGFPSESLSTTSNKWWGCDDHDDTSPDKTKSQPEESRGEAEKKECETRKAENSEETPQGSSLLRAVRKRAVEEGREAFKLGVFRGYGVNKVAKREKILLHQIFGSSLPKSWIHDL